MTIAHFCNKKIITVFKNTSVSEIAGKMEKENVGTVVVVEERNGITHPIGIVTDRDIVIKAISQNKNTQSTTAQDVMNSHVLIFKKDQHGREVLQEMKSHKVRRAPIVDHDNKLCGIVSVDDFFVRIGGELKDAISLLESQIDAVDNTDWGTAIKEKVKDLTGF